MILSKNTIQEYLDQGKITITPFSDNNLKAASYTFTLSTDYSLEPGEFFVAKTLEHLCLSPKVACFLSTRGSIAQQGIDALQSSIFAEPDTNNPLTIELQNNSKTTIALSEGTPIVKGIFIQVI